MTLLIEIFRSALPATVPILLAALGGMFTWHANVFNIAMEGMLLTSAFCAVAGSYSFHSWEIGILFGIGGSIFISLLFAFFVLRMRAGEFITGIAINTFSIGITTFSLRQLYNVKGSLISPKIQSLPKWNIPILREVPFLGEILNKQAFPLYISFFIIVPIVYIIIFRTSFGLRLRASGYDAKVTDSVGIKSESLKFKSILICGFLCGIGGTFLSLGYMRLFTENMTNGRGWISLAIIILTRGHPYRALMTSLVFGIMEGLGLTLQMYNVPNQFTDMLPYISVLFVLFYSSQKKKLQQSPQ